VIDYWGTRDSEAYKAKRGEVGRNCDLITEQLKSNGDANHAMMSFLFRIYTYTNEVVAADPNALTGQVGYGFDDNWQEERFADKGVEGGHFWFINAGYFAVVRKAFSIAPSKSQTHRPDTWFACKVLECKTSCGFTPHPDNPDRETDSLWASKKHVFFLKGFKADADIRQDDSGRAFVQRQL